MEPGAVMTAQDSKRKEKKEKIFCHLQFLSFCCLGTSGLPNEGVNPFRFSTRSLQGTQVKSLGQELRSQKPCGVAKKNNR